MKIAQVICKTIIIINGVEHIRSETDWTESIKSAQDNGIFFDDEEDIFDWIEISN